MENTGFNTKLSNIDNSIALNKTRRMVSKKKLSNHISSYRKLINKL